MKIIGNIVTEKQTNDNPWFKTTMDLSDIVDTAPTLIIGWEKTKKLFPEANILNWKIDENTYWCFGRYENRSQNEKMVSKFINMAMERFIKSQHYHFFSLLTATKEEKVMLLNFLSNPSKKAVFVTNDIIYVSEEGNKEVTGISLRDIDYEGGNRKKIFNIFYSNPSVTMIENKSIPFELRNIFKNSLYAIPYIYL